MDVLLDYASFLAKTFTVVVAIVIVLLTLAGLRARGRERGQGQMQVHKLNEFYQTLKEQLHEHILDKAALKALRKQSAKERKLADKHPEDKPRVYVLDFAGDIKASAVEHLRHEITALLSVARDKDEVVVRLESGGGMVHSYGLAASQLARIREAGIGLTICVDKIAASGGYMMACIGSQILSAPFAILGSIGVVAQVPNVHRLLKKHDVDVELLTAGQYKRTLTVLGENTEQGREKFQEDLDVTHQLFKDFVSQHRPQLDIEKVATGETWLGQAALGLKLVDGLKTSDQYLAERALQADVYSLDYQVRKSMPERLGLAASHALENSVSKGWGKLLEQRFWH